MGTNWAIKDVSQHLLQKQSKTPGFPIELPGYAPAAKTHVRFMNLSRVGLLRLLCRQAKTAAAAAAAAVLHHADFYKARRPPARAGSHDKTAWAPYCRVKMFSWGYPPSTRATTGGSNVTHARAQSFGGALMLCVGGGFRQ
ncbi:hypothetical protein BB8028_0002g08470 [Beauveria bassiana]|uniref:Uncharacterized protein n=1 Tax=Beauveria bassiana TaxID=176275 RepID=A0A2S7Y2Z7_BEABA|nr:hypothetical protein BB8028_0002g08470 [Beauveria bassiana]